MTHKYKYIIESAAGTETIINGQKYLYFAGTGYFQLNSHKELIRAASEATKKYGIACATSRAITGTTPLLLEIEKKIAAFFNTEDAVYLPSGYLCNIAGIIALSEMNTYDIIYIDDGSHYSLIEGVKVSGKPVVYFNHRDIDDLKLKINNNLETHKRPLIASDGLFPVWARLAPLDSYIEIAEQYNGMVWIDDAHGVGILGMNGRGTYEYFGLKSDRLFMGATLSKAFGAYGGIIPGKVDFIEKIKTGSIVTGSSSPMNAAVGAGLKGLEVVKNNPEIRESLWSNARYLKAGIMSLGIKTDNNFLPIIAFAPGDYSTMTHIHKALMDEGIYIQFANYRGAGNAGVLRIVVFSTHTKAQIDFLIDSLKMIMANV